MNPVIQFLMKMTCLIPAIAGFMMYKKISYRIHPFIYMMMLDVVIELINSFATDKLINFYMLLSFSLFLILMYINNYISKKLMLLLLVADLVLSLTNWIHSGFLSKPYSYGLCFISAAGLFISITVLSKQIFAIKSKMLNNAWFWWSSTSILYNAYALLIFGLSFFALSDAANAKAINIWRFVNLLCYLFYTVAIFKIPRDNENDFVKMKLKVA